jgi:hypothetical protein
MFDVLEHKLSIHITGWQVPQSVALRLLISYVTYLTWAHFPSTLIEVTAGFMSLLVLWLKI